MNSGNVFFLVIMRKATKALDMEHNIWNRYLGKESNPWINPVWKRWVKTQEIWTLISIKEEPYHPCHANKSLTLTKCPRQPQHALREGWVLFLDAGNKSCLRYWGIIYNTYHLEKENTCQLQNRCIHSGIMVACFLAQVKKKKRTSDPALTYRMGFLAILLTVRWKILN